MDKDKIQAISDFTFSRIIENMKNRTIVISAFKNDYENLQDYMNVKKNFGFGHNLIDGYSVSDNKEAPELYNVLIIYTYNNKYWLKKNLGKHEQRYGHKNFIIVDENNIAYLIDCTNADITTFEEKCLGEFSADTMKYLCPDTVFTDIRPYSFQNAIIFERRKIKFSEDDSIDVFNEKLEQKYNELSNRLKRRIITQIINIAKQKGETK